MNSDSTQQQEQSKKREPVIDYDPIRERELKAVLERLQKNNNQPNNQSK